MADCINTLITKHYKCWHDLAVRLTGDVVKGEDLLHEVLMTFLNKSIADQERIACHESLNKFITACIHNEIKRDRSRYNWLYTRINQYITLTGSSVETEAVNNPDADQINGEKIFSLINALSLHDAALLRLYAMPDFSYERMSEETGIPVYYLHKRIQRAKEKIKRNAIQL